MRLLLPLLAAFLLSLPLSVAQAQADTKLSPPKPFPGPGGGDVEPPDSESPPPAPASPKRPVPQSPRQETPESPQPEPVKPESPQPNPATSQRRQPYQPLPVGPGSRIRLEQLPALQLQELEGLFLQLREERRNVFNEKVHLELKLIELESRLTPGPGRESLSSNLSSGELSQMAEELKSLESRVLEMGLGVDTMSRKLELLRDRLEEFQRLEDALQSPGAKRAE